jgi:hypothetical protein
MPTPKRRRRAAIKPPPGAGSAPDGRDEARPAARGRPTGSRGRSHGASVALRLHPPRWADVRARRNLTKQPTSRLCSADESVVTDRRCQRPATRSFHGLCGPLQGPKLSVPAWRCLTRRRPASEPKPGVRVPRPSSVTASRRGVGPLGAFEGSPSPPAAEAVGETGDEGGRNRVPLQRLFSAGARAPCRSLASARDRSRVCRPG